jgi:hypothetical protein
MHWRIAQTIVDCLPNLQQTMKRSVLGGHRQAYRLRGQRLSVTLALMFINRRALHFCPQASTCDSQGMMFLLSGRIGEHGEQHSSINKIQLSRP